MDTASATSAVMRAAGGGPATWAMGSLFERLVSGTETGGEIGMSLVTQPPGLATPLHSHSREAEGLYLLAGSMLYKAGEDMHRLTAGSFLFLPKGMPHAFRITGDTPARFLGFTVPGGLMDLYDEVGMPAPERRLPGADGQSLEVEIPRWNEAAPRYGLQVVGPPLPPED
jgi:quercetin dioxygenase-like cupin family protein